VEEWDVVENYTREVMDLETG